LEFGVWSSEFGDQDRGGDRVNQSAGKLGLMGEKLLDGSVVEYILLGICITMFVLFTVSNIA